MTVFDWLLNRLEAVAGDTVLFSATELSNWPEADVSLLHRENLLQRTAGSTEIICPGCENQCSRPVEHVGEGHEIQYFIVCDIRSDTNRVAIDRSDIESWSCSGSLLATSIAKHLGIAPANNSTSAPDKQIIGLLRGNKHSSHLLLEFKEQAQLTTAGRSAPASELIWIIDEHWYVDRLRLTAMIDNPIAAAGTEESSEKRAERLLARKNQLKSAGVRNFRQIIADEEGISKQRVGQIISSLEENKKILARWSIPLT